MNVKKPFHWGRLILVVVVLATPLLAWFAWRWGRRDPGQTSQPIAPTEAIFFQVAGSSMVPTLLGPSQVFKCQTCRLEWFIDANAARATADVMCSHCGESMTVVDRDADIDGDVVEVEPLESPQNLAFGDLVAVRWNEQLNVKRIVALPGDLVEADGLRLIVESSRVEDLLRQQWTRFELPRLLVDDDTRRESSRWKPAEADSQWKRRNDRSWKWTGTRRSTWLIYQHQSVYDNDRPSPIWDDYQFNAGIARQMHEVDRIEVSGTAIANAEASLEFAFWSDEGSRLVSIPLLGERTFTLSDFDGVAQGDLPVSPERPVAVRVSNGPVELQELRIERLIQYRLRTRDDRSRYPLRIGAEECFVLGDNVPVSLDSRDDGPVPLANILGRVVRAKRKSNHSVAR